MMRACVWIDARAVLRCAAGGGRAGVGAGRAVGSRRRRRRSFRAAFDSARGRRDVAGRGSSRRTQPLAVRHQRLSRRGNDLRRVDSRFDDKHIEFSAGVGYYNRAVPSIYRDLVNGRARRRGDPADAPAARSCRSRASSASCRSAGPATCSRTCGVGRRRRSTSRYSEIGEFVDTTDLTIFPATATARPARRSAPCSLVGVRFPIGGDIYGLNSSGGISSGSGDTGGAENGFLSDKIDLSGGHFNFGFLVRF